MDATEDGGFEPAEGKFEIGEFGNGKWVTIWIALKGGFGDGGPARLGKTEYFGDFVKNFADCIVPSAADNLEVIVVRHVD